MRSEMPSSSSAERFSLASEIDALFSRAAFCLTRVLICSDCMTDMPWRDWYATASWE